MLKLFTVHYKYGISPRIRFLVFFFLDYLLLLSKLVKLTYIYELVLGIYFSVYIFFPCTCLNKVGAIINADIIAESNKEQA